MDSPGLEGLPYNIVESKILIEYSTFGNWKKATGKIFDFYQEKGPFFEQLLAINPSLSDSEIDQAVVIAFRK